MQQPQTQPPKPTTSSIAKSCANNLLGILRFPFLIISKITQKLLSPVKRTQRRNQNHSPAFAFKVVWITALLIGEVFIFSYSMRKCSWPVNENWVGNDLKSF